MRRDKLLTVPTVLSEAQARDQPLIDRMCYEEVRHLRATEHLHGTMNTFYQSQAGYRVVTDE